MKGKKQNIIPLIFAVDDNYAPFLSVTLKSILLNSSKNYYYKIYVLNQGLSDKNIKKLNEYNYYGLSSIKYINVEKKLSNISEKLHLRDYYTMTIYYRIFISSLFPQYDKVLYLDSDLVVIGDIAELFNKDVGGFYVGAVVDEVVDKTQVFADYVELGLGVKRTEYFNSGVMLMNLKILRKINIEEKFLDLLLRFKFEVAPDQDYFNVICKGNTKLIELGWNKSPIQNSCFNDKDLKIIHYKLALKPWHYDNVLYDGLFWKYAIETNYYQEILFIKSNYTFEKKRMDSLAYEKLTNMARAYVNDAFNYKKSQISCV